jgi:hypothetical protein
LIFDCFYRTYHYENKIGPKNDAGPLTKRKIAKLDKIKSLREFDKSLILFVYGVANTIILFFIENSISSILAPLDISEGTTKMILIFAPILIDLILLFVLVIKTFSRFMKIENITKNLPIFMSF